MRAKAKSSLDHLREKSGEIEERRERDVKGVKELSVTCGIIELSVTCGIEREKKKKILCN